MALALFSDPFFTDVDRVMNRMLSNATSNALAAPQAAARTGGSTAGTTHAMAMDIVETATAYELHADTPGMAPEDIKVEMHPDGVLTVSGQRKITREDKDAAGKVWRSERSSYSFARSFTLPDNTNADGITASMDKGVLTVTVPKKDPPPKPEPKRIAIASA